MEDTSATKKEKILELYDKGFDVESITDALATNSSYVANTIIQSGRPVDYEDLYTTTSGRSYSPEARRLSGILRFRDIEAARESVKKLEEAYEEFRKAGNRRGQHRAQMLALVGMNRAEGIGKLREAQIFRDWLVKTLEQETGIEKEREKAA